MNIKSPAKCVGLFLWRLSSGKLGLVHSMQDYSLRKPKPRRRLARDPGFTLLVHKPKPMPQRDFAGLPSVNLISPNQGSSKSLITL